MFAQKNTFQKTKKTPLITVAPGCSIALLNCGFRSHYKSISWSLALTNLSWWEKMINKSRQHLNIHELCGFFNKSKVSFQGKLPGENWQASCFARFFTNALLDNFNTFQVCKQKTVGLVISVICFTGQGSFFSSLDSALEETKPHKYIFLEITIHSDICQPWTSSSNNSWSLSCSHIQKNSVFSYCYFNWE